MSNFFDHVRSMVLQSNSHWSTATETARVLQDHVLGILRGIEATSEVTVAAAAPGSLLGQIADLWLARVARGGSAPTAG